MARGDRVGQGASSNDQKKGSAPHPPIAFFIPGLNGGGAQRVFVTLVNTLVGMTQHPIHLVTSREGGAFESLVDERVVRVVLGQKRVSLSILPLARYIRTERPAAMVSTLNYCNVVFLLAAGLARVPLRKVVRDANVIPDEFHSLREKLKAVTLRLMMRLFYRRADDVIIIAKDIEGYLVRHHIAPISHMRRIPNPVIVDRVAACSPTSRPPEERFIVAIGRLSHQKGFDVLIRAFANLADRELRLAILGEGPLKKTLKDSALECHVAERVLFPGFVPNTADYLRAASLFVLPSRWEGFSNVLVEALAVGTPIVASDCPGSPREVLDGGRLGRLVPVGDPWALSEAITRELDRPSATPDARRQSALQYNPEKIAAQYLRILTGAESG